MKLTRDQINNISERIDFSSDGYIVLVDVAGRKDIPVEQHCTNMFCIDANNEIIWHLIMSLDPEPLLCHGERTFTA
jgi:signal transduction histidine kinase